MANNRDNPPRYELRSVHDFLIIPKERRDVCVREFIAWCDVVEASIVAFLPIKVEAPDAFVWIDDGKHEVTIGVRAGDKYIHVARGIMKEDDDDNH